MKSGVQQARAVLVPHRDKEFVKFYKSNEKTMKKDLRKTNMLWKKKSKPHSILPKEDSFGFSDKIYYLYYKVIIVFITLETYCSKNNDNKVLLLNYNLPRYLCTLYILFYFHFFWTVYFQQFSNEDTFWAHIL